MIYVRDIQQKYLPDHPPLGGIMDARSRSTDLVDHCAFTSVSLSNTPTASTNPPSSPVHPTFPPSERTWDDNWAVRLSKWSPPPTGAGATGTNADADAVVLELDPLRRLDAGAGAAPSPLSDDFFSLHPRTARRYSSSGSDAIENLTKQQNDSAIQENTRNRAK